MNFRSTSPYNKKTNLNLNLLSPKYLVTWIGLAILYPLTKLPIFIQHFLGQIIGMIFLFLNQERRKIARINIGLCYPYLSKDQVNFLVKENFKNLGIGVFEMGLSWWAKDKRIEGFLTSYSNKELLTNSIKNKEGILVLIKHSTHLELDLKLISSICDMGGMYRPQKNLVINYFMTKSRNSFLNGIVSNSEARRGIIWIKKGLKFFYAADQDYGKRVSEFIPFFGNEAATVTLPGDLASKGVAIIFADVRREKYNYKVKLHKFREIDSRKEFLLEMNKHYEKVISEAPEEYLWIHRRFKSIKKGKENIYPSLKKRERKRRLKKGDKRV